jgi:hypothetical protein
MKKNNIKKILLHKKTQIATGVFLLLVFLFFMAFNFYNLKKENKIFLGHQLFSQEQYLKSECDKKQLTGECLQNRKEEIFFGVMIDNHPDALPQFGLSDADIVYSTIVEGGITRFLAFFSNLSDVEKIGPIRSARPYFLDIVSEINPLYVHVGGSNDALTKIKELELNDLNEMTSWGPLYFDREEDIGYFAPHNTFIYAEKMNQAYLDFGFSTTDFTSWSFAEEEKKTEDVSVSTIRIDYSVGNLSDVEYLYSEEKKVFHRHQNNVDYKDAGNNELIEIDNLIIQKVPREEILDRVGRLAIDLVGEGEALYFSRGQVTIMTWQKKDITSRTKYFDEAGEEMKFSPGNFWIEIVPGTREVIYE